MASVAPVRCRFCGRGPALALTLHQHTGMIVMMQHRTLRGPFCRECGLRLWKKMAGHSAALGWWGIISLFVGNPLTLILDGIAWLRLSRLAPPQGPPPQPAAPPGPPPGYPGYPAPPDGAPPQQQWPAPPPG